MQAHRTWIALSLASSLLFLFARPFSSGNWPVVAKTLSIVLLAVIGFGINRLLGCALALSAIGDLVLGLQKIGKFGADALFMGGLVAFLLAHVLYIAMFVAYLPKTRSRLGPWRIAGVALVVIVLASMLRVLYPKLGSMLLPVIVYSLVLCTMATSALLADLGNPWAGIGALCFVASDGMLAIAKFHVVFPASAWLVWTTYYMAQLGLLEGVRRGVESRTAAGGVDAANLRSGAGAR